LKSKNQKDVPEGKRGNVGNRNVLEYIIIQKHGLSQGHIFVSHVINISFS
jgi:hypothetical protein